MVTFELFEEMSHEDIQSVLIEHLQDSYERQHQTVLAMQSDSRSRSLKNRVRERSEVIAEIRSIMEDLGIDPDEIE